jgi:predicted CoA-binding protein
MSAPPVWAAPTAVERLDILQAAHRVAIVGMSSKPTRASYFVATYLLAESAYELAFVNPAETEVLGRPCYPSLAALPDVPDLVDVFRRVADLPSVADEAIAVGAPVLWFQLGLRDDATASRATAAGLQVVQDRCLKIEHARFKGGLHLAGFDTGVISARRRRTL